MGNDNKATKPKKKPSKKKLIEMAKVYAGVIVDMAESYGCCRQAMSKWCKDDPQIQEAMKEGCDVLVDLAKSGLKYHLEKKSEKSIHYTLDRLARNQGFGQHLTVKDKSKFDASLDDLTDEELLQMEKRNSERINAG